MPPYPLKIEALLAKVQGSKGTDAAPTAADDGVRGAEGLWTRLNPQNAFPNRREDVVNGSLIAPQPAAPAGRFVEFEIPWEARGLGAAYSATDLPEASPLFRACGLSETVDATVGSETVTYDRADDSHEYATIYLYSGGKLYKLVDCRGTLAWPWEAGQLGRFTFRMSGLLVDDPTEVSVPATTYQAQIPEAAKGMTLTIGAWTPDAISGEFDLAGQLQRLDSGTAPDAIDQFAISRFQPRYRLTARAVEVSTYDPFSDSKTPTSRALVQRLGTGDDGSSYNRINLTGTLWLPDLPGHVEDSDFAGWELEYDIKSPSIVFD